MRESVRRIRHLLQEGHCLDGRKDYSRSELTHALLMLISDADELVRQKACWELGKVVARTKAPKIDDLLRRLLWRLNPESGDNPVGVPEALGEIGNRTPQQIEGFVPAMLQYLEDEELQPGLLQAAGRIGQNLPRALEEHISKIAAYLDSEVASISGNALLALVRIGGDSSKARLHNMREDTREIKLFCTDAVTTTRLCDLVGHKCKMPDSLCFIMRGRSR
jgi:hypothetical protein